MSQSRKWQRATAVAERQHRVIAVWQLLVLGISEHAIAARVQRHGWRRLSHGVVALPGTMSPLRRLAAVVLAYSAPTGGAQRVEQAMEQRSDVVTAVVAAAMGSGQLVAGRSALWLYGMMDPPTQHWLRLPGKCGHAERPGVRLRYGPATGAVVACDGLPTVDVIQGLKDVAGCPDTRKLPLHHQLTRAVATGTALRLVTLDGISTRLDEGARFIGAPVLRGVVADLRGELTHSQTERTARRLAAPVLARYGLTLHPRPYPIEVGGRTVAEADLPVVEIKLDLEVDGPHHLLPAQREKDQARDRKARRAQWVVERFSTELIDLHPEKFTAAVDECVRARLGR